MIMIWSELACIQKFCRLAEEMLRLGRGHSVSIAIIVHGQRNAHTYTCPQLPVTMQKSRQRGQDGSRRIKLVIRHCHLLRTQVIRWGKLTVDENSEMSG